MFYCDACAKKNDWPSGFPHPQSFGPCEMCDRIGVCTDIPSAVLPDFQAAFQRHQRKE